LQVSETVRPEPDRADPPVMADQSLSPAESAPDDADFAAFADGDIMDTVDKETGEIVDQPAPKGGVTFTLPGKGTRKVSNVDDWFSMWEGLCQQVINSGRLGVAEKEAKIRLLKKENEANIKRFGVRFVARMNADVAARVKEIHAPAEQPGGSNRSAASPPVEPSDTKEPSA